MREFESSHSSQPVRRLEILPSAIPEMPANGGLLRIGGWSLDSGFGRFRLGLADSLRRIFEIFPFSGDSDRRPGSIRTAGPCLEWNIAKFSATTAGKLGMPSSDCSAERRAGIDFRRSLVSEVLIQMFRIFVLPTFVFFVILSADLACRLVERRQGSGLRPRFWGVPLSGKALILFAVVSSEKHDASSAQPHFSRPESNPRDSMHVRMKND